MKNPGNLIAFVVIALLTSFAYAADVEAPKAEAAKADAAKADTPKAVVKYVDPNPWTHKTKRLDRAQLDKLLGHPEKILFIDVRRPDELTKLGGFPIYLSIQAKNLADSLDYIPKGRQIVTVSNRAHRAGDAGDLLLSKGFKVAGAAGVLDYEDQGGWLTKIAVPPPRPASAVAATTTVAAEKK
jgi:rhodanese-related sulfurtransferase